MKISYLTARRNAFNARGTQTQFTPQWSTIRFGAVTYNQNGGYNPATSKFRCSNYGLYLFYVTIASYHGKDYGGAWFQIVQDNIVRFGGITHIAGVGTNFAMIKCSPGSQIWVREGHVWWPLPIHKQGMWGGHSQFGGFEIAYD